MTVTPTVWTARQTYAVTVSSPIYQDFIPNDLCIPWVRTYASGYGAVWHGPTSQVPRLFLPFPNARALLRPPRNTIGVQPQHDDKLHAVPTGRKLQQQAPQTA
jgi:hypothetical protein